MASPNYVHLAWYCYAGCWRWNVGCDGVGVESGGRGVRSGVMEVAGRGSVGGAGVLFQI